jgi:hypothetical protein
MLEKSSICSISQITHAFFLITLIMQVVSPVSGTSTSISSKTNTIKKGQVLGFWHTNRNVLNEVTEGSVDSSSTESLTSLVSKMRLTMLNLKGDFMDASGTSVRYDLIKGSPKFQEYLSLTRQLKFVNMSEMNQNERKAFLINIYNSLVIHSLVEGLLKKFPGGSLSRLQMYSSASYNIGGEVYSLNDIENGLLRGNRLSAAPFTKVPFALGDKRIDFMIECDPRIHFALNCGAVSCPPIGVYSGDIIDDQLDIATRGFVGDNTVVNKADSSITLSMLFSWYKEDFGDSSRKIIEWLLSNSSKKVSDSISAIEQPSLKYAKYNWNLND